MTKALCFAMQSCPWISLLRIKTPLNTVSLRNTQAQNVPAYNHYGSFPGLHFLPHTKSTYTEAKQTAKEFQMSVH